MQRLIDIITAEGILPRLKATDKDGAFIEIVERLVETGRVEANQQEDILMALLKRESLGATNIGNHVAIPHVKTELVNSFVGALARSRDGIIFEEGEPPVHVIILFLSPQRAVSGHLRLLAHIGGILNHEAYVKLLLSAVGKADLLELVKDAERMIFGEEHDPPDGGTPVLA